MNILNKGTLVRHGTISSLLPWILKDGIRPRGFLHKIRETSEAKPYSYAGIYVGGLVAYYASYLSFTDVAKQLTHGKVSLGEGAVPVVLQIELGEDCQIVSDEDFIMRNVPHEKLDQHTAEFQRRVIDDAMDIWMRYKSAVVIREGGIPASWIKRIEFPEIKLIPSPKTDQDVSLLSFSCVFPLMDIEERIALQKFGVNDECFGLSNSSTPGKIISSLSQFSAFTDLRKRASWINYFHRRVGANLSANGVPQN